MFVHTRCHNSDERAIDCAHNTGKSKLVHEIHLSSLHIMPSEWKMDVLGKDISRVRKCIDGLRYDTADCRLRRANIFTSALLYSPSGPKTRSDRHLQPWSRNSAVYLSPFETVVCLSPSLSLQLCLHGPV